MLRRLIEWGGSGARAFGLERHRGSRSTLIWSCAASAPTVVSFHPGRVGDGHPLMRLRGVLALYREVRIWVSERR
jgi:hypothetical protein